MWRLSVGLSAFLLFGLSACGESAPPETPESASEFAAPEAEVDSAPAAPEAAPAAVSAAAESAVVAGPGAPSFAVIYPGGVIQDADEGAAERSGASGLVTYVTAASPDEVIAFYRTRAEAEGLASVMAMNQGEARAYGAHSTQSGANLSVFATPIEDGVSVQLVWGGGG